MVPAGVCGSAANGTYSWDAPPTTGLCSIGTKSTPTSNSSNTQWSWTCTGPSGGSSASCTANETYLSLTGSTITPTCAVGGTAQTFTGSIINSGNASTNTAFNNYFETNTASQGSGMTLFPAQLLFHHRCRVSPQQELQDYGREDLHSRWYQRQHDRHPIHPCLCQHERYRQQRTSWTLSTQATLVAPGPM